MRQVRRQRRRPGSRVRTPLHAVALILVSLAGARTAIAGETGSGGTFSVNLPAVLVPPFDVEASREAAGKRSTKAFTCKAVPPPVAVLSLESKYARTDGHADIDPERLKAYEQATAPLESFKRPLIQMANRYVRSRPADPAIARCVLSWLSEWARQGALERSDAQKGEAARAAALTVISLAFAQVGRDPSLPRQEVGAVTDWIRRLADLVRADYTTGDERGSRRNNLRYWAAWSVMTASFVLNDHTMFQWAVDSARIGIEQISADGTLPLELQRRQRALGYHVFALAALVLLAEGAAANGIDLYGEDDQAILRLARRTLAGLDHPADFERMTGFRQDLRDTMNASKIAFIVLLAPRLGDVDIAGWRKRVGRLTSTGLGGDVELIYGPAMRRLGQGPL